MAVGSSSAPMVIFTPASGTQVTAPRLKTTRRRLESSCGSTGSSGKAMVIAYGLRNPWRYSFDRATGAIYIGDVGAGLREEVNRLPKKLRGKANFGWDIFEGNVRRRPIPVGLPGVLVKPFLEYHHQPKRCNSVVGGYVYRGREVPSLRGRYVYGDLCGGMWRSSCDTGRLSSEDVSPSTLPTFSPPSASDLTVSCMS